MIDVNRFPLSDADLVKFVSATCTVILGTLGGTFRLLAIRRPAMKYD